MTSDLDSFHGSTECQGKAEREIIILEASPHVPTLMMRTLRTLSTAKQDPPPQHHDLRPNI